MRQSTTLRIRPYGRTMTKAEASARGRVCLRRLATTAWRPVASVLLREPFYSRLHHLAVFPLRHRARTSPQSAPVAPEAVPRALRSYPGTIIDEQAANRAFADQPLRDFWVVYRDWDLWINTEWWRFIWRVLPHYVRAEKEVFATRAAQPQSAAPAHDPAVLTERMRAEAARLGLSAVGFADYDPRWTYADSEASISKRSVIICVLEEDHAVEQTAPSARHERRTMEGYAVAMRATSALARSLQARGHRAEPHGPDGPFMFIPYAVEAGLGQMGLNGQLLTPSAGARIVMTAITTTAPLVAGRPVDYGIPAICDACKACVRRCPVGAIPARRNPARGVLKAKINTGRCLPVVGQADGCAVCSKVCPVQRYGLPRIYEHFERTGHIYGRGTDELEGYSWPLDGRYYPAGKKPSIKSEELLRPKGRRFDPTLQTVPPAK
jgi:epoxyqueuosine reductase